MTIEKRGGILRCLNAEGFQTRAPSTLWCAQQADAAHVWPDFCPVELHIEDKGGDALLSYSKQNPNTAADYDRIIPDFTFRHWNECGMGDYDALVAQISAAGLVAPARDMVGWVGNLATNPMRRRLFELGQQRPDLLDIRAIDWEKNRTSYLSLPALVSMFGILIDVEGAGWSARTKFLFWSHRPLILVERPHKEYYYEHLRAWQHYVPVKRDLSDLLEQVAWVQQHPVEAQVIAENAYTFAQEHLTRTAAWRQWDRVIRAAAKTHTEKSPIHTNE